MITGSAMLVTAVSLLVVLFFVVFIVRLKRKSGHKDSGLCNEQVYVGNLPYRANEEDLRRYFSAFGSLKSVRIIRNFRTGDSKGYAFVTYANTAQANAALVANGKELQGRAMVVRIAKPRQSH